MNEDEVEKKSLLSIENMTFCGFKDQKTFILLMLWYIFSAITLFLNKYILSYQGEDPKILCAVQMLSAMICGFIQIKYPLGIYKSISGQRRPSNFYINMVIIGLLQLCTIIFGLVAMYFVAVSFAETVKSSAPIFTVIISRFILGEKTGLYVQLSLIPVMLGLVLCSSYELSFNFWGLLCAMATNISECIQGVFSKRLFSDSTYKYNPAELQFYPNVAAIMIQLVLWMFLSRDLSMLSMKKELIVTSIVNGISFHGQTITAYALMSCINPVTYSVANTTKRAFLIWMSVLLFNNPVTYLSGIGTIFVIGGVFVYNKARELDATRRDQFTITKDHMNGVH